MTIFIVITEDKRHWLWQSIIPTRNVPGAPLIYTHAWWFTFQLRLLLFASYYWSIYINSQDDTPSKIGRCEGIITFVWGNSTINIAI